MTERLPRRALDGVLLLDKPLGPSSNDALQRVRWLFAARKGGHGGTLDPLASGLLPIGFGEATKFINRMIDADKTYEARIALGEVSSTGDAEGERQAVDPTRAASLTAGEIEQALARFRGAISQRPPMHAAIKHGGRPLYASAREGVDVERPERPVTVHELELLTFERGIVTVRARVSKGTYIRVLAEEIGAALGCGGWLAALRRTAVGPFGVAQAVTMTALEAALGLSGDGRHPAFVDAGWHRRLDTFLLPVDAMLADLPRVDLPGEDARLFAHGQEIGRGAATPAGQCRVYAPHGFLGLGQLDRARLRPVRLLAA